MKPLQMKDFLQYKFISQLEYAPGEETAAFVISQADWEDNGYKSNIWTMDVKSEKLSPLTTMGDAKSFIWLNEKEILFPAIRLAKDKECVKKGEKLTVFNKISVCGGEAGEAFRVPYAVSAIKKVTDTTFAMICYCHPADPDFGALHAEQKAEAYKRLEEERDYEVLDEIPFWFNGQGFTNKKRTRLFVFDAESGKGVFATDELSNVLDFKVQDGKIAYVANRFQNKQELKPGAFVYDIAARTTQTLLPPGELRLSFIDFWDGGFIVKGSHGKDYGNGEFAKFYTIQDGNVSLFCDIDEASGNLTNSDCRYGSGTNLRVYEGEIYYSCVEHVQNALRKIRKDGTVETILKRDESFDAFAIGSQGIICYGLGPVTLQELYKVEGDTARQISDFNGAFVRETCLMMPERCDAQSGAETIEGFVLKPVDFDPAKKYPAVLNIHGGPKTAIGNTYFHEAHYWSARGYFVLFCNPRGSDGRGDAFADLRGKYGTIDYDDLMAFTDTCLEAYPQIDAKRLCVTGGSYGGFMTNWIIGHTDRFACAASQRSISNWISKFGTTDIGYYFNADQQQSTPWDNVEKMWWHSPMKYADKCVTPTLFIHSEEDYRCWLAEGLQMFTSLKYHGCEARLCMFKGENHELSRSGKPKHRVRRLTEITDWFEKYAK